MNVAAPAGPSGAISEQTGVVKSFKGLDQDFKQMLQALVTEVQNNTPDTETLNTNSTPKNWLNLLFGLFENGSFLEAALDSQGEALSEGEGESDVKASLTEIMFALQPLVGQSDVAALATDPEAVSQAAANIAEAGMQSVAPAVIAQAMEAISAPSDAAANPAAQTGETRPLITAPIPGQHTESQPNSVAGAQTSQPPALQESRTGQTTAQQGASLPVAGLPVEKTNQPASLSADAAQTTSSTSISTAPTLYSRPSAPANPATTTNPTAGPTSDPVANAATTDLRSALDSQPRSTSSPQADDGRQPVVLSAQSNATVTAGKAAQPAAPAPATLPQVPALHQIVNSVRLMTSHGESQVRLQLQPEALGQVLVQLHMSNGDVSVRMLAETVQAQALIQEHLPQLKAALASQGLQINQLNIDVGNNLSAFDTPDRAPQDSHTNNGNGRYQNSDQSASNTASSTGSIGSGPNVLGSPYSVDYHA